MRAFCEFNIETGQLVQRGRCGNQCVPRTRRDGSAIAFISTSSTADRITSVEIDSEGVAINPVLHKANEAEKENQRNKVIKPRRVFPEQNNDNISANITNKQWRNMQDRITQLENN